MEKEAEVIQNSLQISLHLVTSMKVQESWRQICGIKLRFSPNPSHHFREQVQLEMGLSPNRYMTA